MVVCIVKCKNFLHLIMLVPLLIATLISTAIAQSGHPEFDPPMEQVVLEEGSQGTVKCEAKGELPLTYTWYNKMDAEIKTDANEGVFIQRFETRSNLFFAEVMPSHAGLYSCSATNRHGTASKPFDIIVNSTSGNNITTNETPGILKVEVSSVADESVEFSVQTKGNPDSFYIRYREKLDKVENYVQIRKGEKAVVKNLVPSGGYRFWFQIDPPFPKKDSSVYHYITLLPGVPDVIFRNIRDGLVELEWFRSIDDLSRDTVEEYELSYNRVQVFGGRTWDPSNCVITVKIPFQDCSAARYTIAGLQAQKYYEIRLRARTESGYGRANVNKVYVL